MGCFSYLCSVCGEPINSTSYDGEQVKLFYIIKGEVVEEMEGAYDSYGAVFASNGEISLEWQHNWIEMVTTHYDEDDPTSGCAAIHSACWSERIAPCRPSEDDPEQGWGELNPKYMRRRA